MKSYKEFQEVFDDQAGTDIFDIQNRIDQQIDTFTSQLPPQEQDLYNIKEQIKNTLSYVQLLISDKEQKLKEIYEQLIQKDQEQLNLIFDNQIWSDIANYITSGEKFLEKILLNIIQLVIERVGKSAILEIQQSSLLALIEIMIKEKYKFEMKDYENQQYTDDIDQLVHIYTKIVKECNNNELKDICIKVLNKSDSNIFGSNSISELEIEFKAKNVFEQIQNQNLEQLKESFDIWTFNIILIRIGECKTESQKILLKIILYLAQRGLQQQLNKNIFFFYMHQSGLLDKITQLFKDQFEFEKKEYNNSKYSNLIYQYNQIYQIIMKSQNIDLEIIKICVEITDKKINDDLSKLKIYLKHNNQRISTLNINSDAEKDINNEIIVFVSSSLDFLSLILRNNLISVKSIADYSKIIQSLIEFNNLIFPIYSKFDLDLYSKEIMKYTLDPLGLIQMNGEVLAQTSLTNSGYTNALIQYISTAGGCGFKNDSRLYDVLQHIQNFFYMLQQGRNQYTYNGKFLIPSQPALIKSSNEQLEEQGGSEEIDSLLTMSELDDIMKIANRTKQTLQNIFMDKTNQSPWLLW